MKTEQKIEKYILKYMNISRRKRGKGKLSSNRGLKRVARGHSKTMSKKGKIWHGNGVHVAINSVSHRKGFWGFISSIFFSYSRSGENVGMIGGFRDPQKIGKKFHNMWMKSPGHKANMMNSDFSLVGIGVKKGRKGWFATQLFVG